jgi:hypothetical protein
MGSREGRDKDRENSTSDSCESDKEGQTERKGGETVEIEEEETEGDEGRETEGTAG